MTKRIYYIFLLLLFISTSCITNENEENEYNDEELNEILIQAIALTNELEFEEAYKSLQFVENFARENNLIKYEIIAKINLGRLYYKFSEKDEALTIYLEALALAEANGDEDRLNSIYNNLGILYSDNKLFEEAENYFKRALYISQKLEIDYKEIINYINIASVKENRNQLDSAIYYNKIALNKSDQTNIKKFNSTIYSNIGDVFIKEGNYKNANTYYSLSLTTELSLDSSEHLKPDKANLGLYEFKLGKSFVLLNEPESAKIHLTKALDYLYISNNSEIISKSFLWLAKNEDSALRNDRVQYYYDQSLAWKDSVLYQNKDQWLKDVQLKYEFGQNEKEIEFLEERDQVQKRIIYAIVVISIVFIILIISLWLSRSKNSKQHKEILSKEKELARVEKERNEVEKIKLEEEMANQQRLNKIEEEKIKLQLEHKNKELVSNAVHLMNKNEILQSLLELVEQIELEHSDKNKALIEEMHTSIKNNIHQDRAWEDFRLHFDEVHESFRISLNVKHPDLSPTDFRLAAYLLIGLNNKEIAYVSNISPDSVRKRKQRLRQKLQLDINTDLNEYLKSL
jgi:DNA-binding CsgD family transcriptional regulator/Tfp pilus assembly protein PilF